MKLTLIITTYNWPESLLLVFESIKNQTILPDEVIIADDGSTEETKDLITNFNNNSNINIFHSWQEDIGFRASRSRNKAIIKASGDYIILIDGDMILHPRFIQDHLSSKELGYFIQGSRVLLSEIHSNIAIEEKKINFSPFSSGLTNRKNSIHSTLLSKIFTNKNKHLRGIKSCNMAFYAKDCIKINGFNNDFEGWGREDSEFAARLLNSGIRRKNIRFNAIQYHLWHHENTRVLLDKNNAILEQTLSSNIFWCENGINSIKDNEN